MNIFKTTIATAAVITCCLGNEMPAQANGTFKAGYDYGFLYGLTASACVNYRNGFISRSTMLTQMRVAERQEGSTPAIKSRIVRAFESASRDGQDQGNCLKAVRQVFGRTYQSADHWR